MRQQFVRPYNARRFRSIEMMRRSVENTQVERHTSAPAGVHRTALYTAFAELQDHSGAKPYVVCSGATQLIGGAAGAGNRVGIAAQDHLCETETQFYTRGTFDVPFNPEDATQTGLMGKDAYYVAETGYFTSSATGLGTTCIKVGVFQSDAILATDKSKYPNGIMWVRVLLQQTYDNASLAAPAVLNECMCDNSLCNLYAAPTVTHKSGLAVDFAANAVSGNPAQTIGGYNWNFDGVVTTTGGVVSFATQSTDENPSFTFPSAGTYSNVYLMISAQLEDGSCGCDNVQTAGQTPCCKTYQLEVIVTASSATIVSCNTVDNSTLRNWSTEKTYAKTTAIVVDTVTQVDFTTSTDQAAAGNITDAGQTATAAAIKAAIIAAGFVCTSVLFTVSPAAADGDNQSFTCVVIGTNADLKELDITINGGASTSTFTVIA